MNVQKRFSLRHRLRETGFQLFEAVLKKMSDGVQNRKRLLKRPGGRKFQHVSVNLNHILSCLYEVHVDRR